MFFVIKRHLEHKIHFWGHTGLLSTVSKIIIRVPQGQKTHKHCIKNASRSSSVWLNIYFLKLPKELPKFTSKRNLLYESASLSCSHPPPQVGIHQYQSLAKSWYAELEPNTWFNVAGSGGLIARFFRGYIFSRRAYLQIQIFPEIFRKFLFCVKRQMRMK